MDFMNIREEFDKIYQLSKAEQEELEESYTNYLRIYGSCVATYSKVFDIHHIRIAGHCGMGSKPLDLFCVPLSRVPHTVLHQQGIRFCEEKYGFDLMKSWNKYYLDWSKKLLTQKARDKT